MGTPQNQNRSPQSGPRLAGEAKKLLQDMGKDFVRDLRRIAVIEAKREESTVIDTRHIKKARRFLSPKYQTLRGRLAKVAGYVGSACVGVLGTSLLTPNQIQLDIFPAILLTTLAVAGLIVSWYES